MAAERDPLDSPDQQLTRWGAVLRTCLWYPPLHPRAEGEHAVGFAIDLIAVRAAPGVHVSFDMQKNKWVISTDDGSSAAEWIEVADTPLCFDGRREHAKTTVDGQTTCDVCNWESPEDAARFKQYLEDTRTWRRP